MPKQNRLPILVDKFLRVNEDVALNKLGEGEMPSFINMVLDNPFGVPHIRGAFQEKNSNAGTDDIGKIVDVKSKNGTNYLLSGINTKMERCVGGGWTTIVTGLTSNVDNRGYFRHTAFGDDIIVTNLLDKPFRITGNDLTTNTNLEIEKPDVSQVVIRSATSDVGNMEALSWGYHYILVYVTEVGERSNPSLALSCELLVGTHTASISDKQKYLTNLPIPTDDRVVSKWLYRTESWDGTSTTGGRTFYLRAKLDIATTTFIDGVADIDLDFGESISYSRVPETAQHIAQSNNRVWLGNITYHLKTFFEPSVIPIYNSSNITIDGVTYSSPLKYNISKGLVASTAYALDSLVTNGVFSSDTEWEKGTGWTIAAGVASSDGTQTADSDLSQFVENKVADPNGEPYILVAGRTYDVSFDVANYVSGNVTFVAGGTEGTDRSANGTHTETIVAGDDGTVVIRADLNFVGDVDNVLIGAGGLVATEWHQYMVTFVDVNGYESEPAYGRVMQVDAGVLMEHTLYNVPIASIGANGSSNNPDIKYRRVYRTEGQVATFTENTLPFYLCEEQDIRHDEPHVYLSGDALQYRYFDDLSDARLGAVYAEVNKTAKSAVVWSQADRPSYMLAENIKSIFKDDQDEITGILDDGNGILIFKENSIIKLYHTGASQNWYIRKVWSEFGCDEPKSLAKAGDVIYFRYRNRPYAFQSGSAPVYIGYGKQTTLDTLTVRDIAVTDQWISWLCEDSGDLDYLVTYDKIAKSWYQFNLFTAPSTALGIKAIFIKRYSDFWTAGNIYIAKQKTYEYDITSTTDEHSGAQLGISVELKLPRFKLDTLTKFKLRDLVMSLRRVGANAIYVAVDTEVSSYTAVQIPAAVEGIVRVIGWGGKPVFSTTGFYDLTLTGGIESLDAVRMDVRPIRRGVGSI